MYGFYFPLFCVHPGHHIASVLVVLSLFFNHKVFTLDFPCLIINETFENAPGYYFVMSHQFYLV